MHTSIFWSRGLLLWGNVLCDQLLYKAASATIASLFISVSSLPGRCGLKSVFLPWLQLWVCALQSFGGGYTHETTCTQQKWWRGKKKVIFIQSSCFSWCPHSSRWLFFKKKIDHRTSQTEAKPVFADCKNKIRLHFRRSSYLLTPVHTQRECWAIQLHFPATRQKFKQKKKTRLWSLCSTDNKWPWVRLSCYHWLWSLSGLTVETWHISCHFV